MNKNWKRILIFIIAVVLIITPLQSLFSRAATETGDTVLRNFDAYANTAAMLGQIYISGTSLATGKLSLAETGPSDAGKSLKFDLHDAVEAGKNAGFRLQSFSSWDLRDCTSDGLRFWVKNTDTAKPAKMFIQLEGGARASFQTGKTYYLKDTAGVVYTAPFTNSPTVTEGHVDVPAGFEGFVYLPLATLYSGHINNLAAFYAFWILPYLENSPSKALYFDSVGFYSTNPLPDVLQNFDKYTNSTELLTQISGISTQASGKLSLAENGPSDTEKSLKFDMNDAANAGIRAAFRVQGFGNSLNLANISRTGLRFWAKNTDTAKPAKIFIQLEGSGRASFQSGKPYYLEDSAGIVYSAPFTAGAVTEGHVDIPIGFEGYIYLPFTSLFSGHINSLAGFYGIWFSPYLKNTSGKDLYFDSIGLYSTNPSPTVFQAFDRYSDTTDMLSNINISSGTPAVGRLSLAENGPAQALQSLRVDTHTAVAEDVGKTAAYRLQSFGSPDLTALSGAGLRFWVKSTDSNTTTRLYVQLEGASARATFVPNRAYYLEKSTGQTVRRSFVARPEAADTGCVEIPPSFEGYVYLPYASLYDNHINNMQTFFGFWMGPYLENRPGSALYIDTIGLYAADPTVYSRPIQDFDFYVNTEDLLKETRMTVGPSGNKAEAETHLSLDSALKDGPGGNSMKINTKSSGTLSTLSLKFSMLSAAPESYADYTGFRMWVKNTGTSPVLIQPQTDSAGRDNFKSGSSYFLEQSGVKTKMAYLVAIRTAEGALSIPAGFEGYVYLPFDSAHDSLKNNLDKLNALFLLISLQENGGNTLWIDSLDVYKNEETSLPGIHWNEDTPGMIHGFERSDSVAGYRGYIATAAADPLLLAEIDDTVKKNGSQSLRIYPTTDDASLEVLAPITISLKHENGTLRDLSDYDGIGFWIKTVREKSGAADSHIELPLQMEMPGRARTFGSESYFTLKDGEDITELNLLGSARDGNGTIQLPDGYEGMVYVPFGMLTPFGSEPKDLTKITTLFLYFWFPDMVNKIVYIDDIQPFRIAELPEVQLPGDQNYNPFTDTMLAATNKNYTVMPGFRFLSGGTLPPDKKGDDSSPKTGERSIALLFWLCAGTVITSSAMVILRKKAKGMDNQ